MWYLHYVDCLRAKLINGMQEGLGTGSVNTPKKKVLDNLNKQINSNGIC